MALVEEPKLYHLFNSSLTSKVTIEINQILIEF